MGRGDPNAIELSVRLKATKAGKWTVKVEAGANNVGQSVGEEFEIEVEAGLAPMLSVERLIKNNSNSLRLHASGRANQRYQIQTTTNLVEPVQWTDGPSFDGPEWAQDISVNEPITRAIFYRAVAR